MRAPNGQGCCIGRDRELAIANVGDVMRNCGEQLEAAVGSGQTIEISIHPDERGCLEDHFPDVITTGLRLMALVNTALKRNGLAYELAPANGQQHENVYPFTVRFVPIKV